MRLPKAILYTTRALAAADNFELPYEEPLVQDQNHGAVVWTPNLESLRIRYIPSQNICPYFKPHPSKEEAGKRPNGGNASSL